MRRIYTFLATFAYTGFFPVAPATFASLIFCLVYLFVPGGHWLGAPVVALVTLIVSVPVAGAMEPHYGEDPGCVVIDEIVGMQAMLVFADPTRIGVAVAFVLFRVFDIVKIEPANTSQRLRGGWGIVADDVIAGIYSRVALVLLSLVWPGMGRFGW